MNNKINLFNIEIDSLTMDQTVHKIADWVENSACSNHYVVTPNVDHIVKLYEDKVFFDAYKNASLVVADGKPVVLASKMLGKRLPETVPGSDLVPHIFDYFQNVKNKTLKVYLLGAMPGVAEQAASNIERQWPNIKVVGCNSPNFGFEKSENISLQICKEVSESCSDIVVFGVGAPKQEIWCNQYAQFLNTKTILCVGATIDFLAGEKSRAPIWVRKIGMEWLHRMCTEPKRLFKRYMNDAIRFPFIVLQEWSKSTK
jgi:N-acetylglucosaminyldiphosphoundecaprenol N-acetyl-beta-D-mannosaminyltransferase